MNKSAFLPATHTLDGMSGKVLALGIVMAWLSIFLVSTTE